MIELRDRLARELELDLLVWTNQESLAKNINPFDHDSQRYTHIMKTEALKQALGHYGFDAAVGGARRDEEKSRAKERVFSFRDRFHQWDPKNQRPELWNLYNTRVRKGESMGDWGQAFVLRGQTMNLHLSRRLAGSIRIRRPIAWLARP